MEELKGKLDQILQNYSTIIPQNLQLITKKSISQQLEYLNLSFNTFPVNLFQDSTLKRTLQISKKMTLAHIRYIIKENLKHDSLDNTWNRIWSNYDLLVFHQSTQLSEILKNSNQIEFGDYLILNKKVGKNMIKTSLLNEKVQAKKKKNY